MAFLQVSCLLFSVAIISVHYTPSFCIATEIYYYVKPSAESTCINITTGKEFCWECMTLNDYAESTLLNASNGKYNVAYMVFLPGVHMLNIDLHIENWKSFEMVTCLSDKYCLHHDGAVGIPLCSANMNFNKIGNLRMTDLTITSVCNDSITSSLFILNNVPWYDTQLADNDKGIMISNVCLTLTPLRLLCDNCTGGVSILDTFLNDSSAEFGIRNSHDMEVAIKTVNLTLANCQSGLIFRMLQVKSLSIDNVATSDSNGTMNACSMTHDITPTYDMLFSSNVEVRTKVMITNSRLERRHSTGLKINVTAPTFDSLFSITICGTSISNHIYGGIVIKQTSKSIGVLNFSLDHSKIERNQIDMTENNCLASGLSVHSETSNATHIRIMDTLFNNNSDERFGILPVTVYITRAYKVFISDSNFTNNIGTAIHINNVHDECVSERFIVKGNVMFIGNQAKQGGAMSLLSAVMHIKPFTYLTFENNTVTDVGGAIFVSSNTPYDDLIDPDTLVHCFYQFPNWRNNSRDYDITFGGNRADNGGHDIYGAPIKSYCTVFHSDEEYIMRSIDLDVLDLFHFSGEDHLSSISSNPSRVCIVNNETSVNSACTSLPEIFYNSRDVYYGETFRIDVAIVGAEFGTGVGTVYAQLLQEEANIWPPRNCSQPSDSIDDVLSLYYTVNATESTDKVDLVLTTTKRTGLKPLNSHHATAVMERDIQKYNEFGVISTNLLTTPVYVKINFKKQCPAGFAMRLHSSSDWQEPYYGCHCNTGLDDTQIQCFIVNGRGLFNISHQMWISTNGSTDHPGSIYFHENCPFDYCTVKDDLIDLEENCDAQCANNRGGTLCGACVNNTSLAIGSNNCIKCNNNDNISLVIFFAAAGFILFFFISILNITVAQGTINGLIFYANIVWAYEGILFPNASGIDCKLIFLRVFLAWLNLDFGIEICFFKNLDAYVKTWLQFVFPFYTWMIVGAVIALARCSTKIAALFGENIVQVLATLIFLSYSKLLRTTMIALTPANIQILLNHENEPNVDPLKVWAYDGNLQYFGCIEHICLAAFSLLVLLIFWLPYTALLLYIQPLRSCARYNSCLNWLINKKMKPFLDAYVGPLRVQNHFWIGLLLLLRCTLFVVLLTNYPSNPQACEISLVIVIALLFLLLYHTGHLYNKPKDHRTYRCHHKKLLPKGVSFLTVLEVSFLLNLLVVGAVRLYKDFSDTNRGDKEKEAILIYTSVGIAFLQFLGIVGYHLVQKIRKIYRRYCARGYVDLDSNNDNNNGDNPVSNNQEVPSTAIETPSDDNNYRDSILGETESESNKQSDE